MLVCVVLYSFGVLPALHFLSSSLVSGVNCRYASLLARYKDNWEAVEPMVISIVKKVRASEIEEEADSSKTVLACIHHHLHVLSCALVC